MLTKEEIEGILRNLPEVQKTVLKKYLTGKYVLIKRWKGNGKSIKIQSVGPPLIKKLIRKDGSVKDLF
jgi:hypothetical protein